MVVHTRRVENFAAVPWQTRAKQGIRQADHLHRCPGLGARAHAWASSHTPRSWHSGGAAGAEHTWHDTPAAHLRLHRLGTPLERSPGTRRN